MSKVSYGQVDVELDDESITLKPTLRAYEKIEKKYGGLAQALHPLSNFNLEAIAFVLSAGAALDKKDERDLKERIFARGVSTIAARAVEYVTLLMNPTGRDADEEIPEGN